MVLDEERVVYGDSGYLGAKKWEDATVHNNQGMRIRYKINRYPSKGKNASVRSRAQIKRRERKKTSVWAKVEHVFAVVISSTTEKHDTEVYESRSQNRISCSLCWI